MKKYFADRGFVMPIIITVIALAVIIGTFLWQKNDSDNAVNGDVSPATSAEQNIPSVTQSDIEQGWYYGDINQKKPNTPDSWLLRYSGTRSAQWYDPNR